MVGRAPIPAVPGVVLPHVLDEVCLFQALVSRGSGYVFGSAGEKQVTLPLPDPHAAIPSCSNIPSTTPVLPINYLHSHGIPPHRVKIASLLLNHKLLQGKTVLFTSDSPGLGIAIQ